MVDHLAIIERRVAGLVTRAVGAARDAGLGAEPDDSPQLAGLGGERILDRTTKLRAPDVGLPQAGVGFRAALDALDHSRAALLDAMAAVDGAALGEVKYPHPAMGELSMYQWVAFLGFHEGRHALQIEEIAAELEASASP